MEAFEMLANHFREQERGNGGNDESDGNQAERMGE
jgi:hypothetical protein